MFIRQIKPRNNICRYSGIKKTSLLEFDSCHANDVNVKIFVRALEIDQNRHVYLFTT